MGSGLTQTFRMQGMQCIFHQPASPLSELVECIFEISGKPPSDYLRNYPVLKAEIVFNLSAHPVKGRVQSVDRLDHCSDVVFRGTHTELFELFMDHPLHLFIINLKPGTVPQLFPVSLSELTNTALSMADQLPELDILRERLWATGTPRKRIELATHWLGELAARHKVEQSALVQWIRRKINHSPTLKITELQQQTGYSRQYLHRLYKQEMGIGLKTFQKIVRINRILDELNTGTVSNLTALAHKYHYYDQSHFIKEFKQMTGILPSTLQSAHLDKMPVQHTYFDS